MGLRLGIHAEAVIDDRDLDPVTLPMGLDAHGKPAARIAVLRGVRDQIAQHLPEHRRRAAKHELAELDRDFGIAELAAELLDRVEHCGRERDLPGYRATVNAELEHVVDDAGHPVDRASDPASHLFDLGRGLQRDQVGIAANRTERPLEIVRGARCERRELASTLVDAREVELEQHALPP